jgi:peptidoglycan/LPS O-acetylase OafA/YrhL
VHWLNCTIMARSCVLNERQRGKNVSQSPAAFIILARSMNQALKVDNPEYVPGLDLLRFAAAFAVMLYHLAFWSWAFPAGQVALASKGLADFRDWPLITAVGWVGVQIFFVISGFVIATSAANSSASRFFISRFTRLVPAAWVCATITLIAWLLIDVGAPSSHLRAYAKSIAFVPVPAWIDSVYWTLGVEIAFYALVLGLVASKRFHWLKPVMCGVGLVSSLFWFGYGYAAMDRDSALFAWFSTVQWSRLAQLTLLHHGVFFAMGVLLWMQLMRKSTRGQTGWLLFFIVGGCMQVAADSQLKFEKTGFLLSPLLACAIWLGAMLLLFWMVQNNDRVRSLPEPALRTLRRLGLVTYPLYLLHNVTGGAVLGALLGWGIGSTDALLLTMLLIIALSWWVSVTPEPALQKATRSTLTSLANRLGSQPRTTP